MSQSSGRLHLENILDRRLSLEGASMHAERLWPRTTSATAAAKSKRSRWAEGRALAERSSSRAWKWMWLEVETNWQNGGTLAFTNAGEAANRREGGPD
jgi:hypothetical protein